MNNLQTLTHRVIPRRGMRQLIKFGMVGVVNTAIDFSLYLLLTRAFFIFELLANALAMLVAMSFSFFANKRFTFRNHVADHGRQMLKFVAVQGIGFVLGNGTFYLVLQLGVFDIYAKICGAIVFTSWNFLAQKYWAFKEK